MLVGTMSKNQRQRQRQKTHMLASTMSKNRALSSEKHFLPPYISFTIQKFQLTKKTPDMEDGTDRITNICLPALEGQQRAQGGHYIIIIKS